MEDEVSVKDEVANEAPEDFPGEDPEAQDANYERVATYGGGEGESLLEPSSGPQESSSKGGYRSYAVPWASQGNPAMEKNQFCCPRIVGVEQSGI